MINWLASYSRAKREYDKSLNVDPAAVVDVWSFLQWTLDNYIEMEDYVIPQIMEFGRS